MNCMFGLFSLIVSPELVKIEFWPFLFLFYLLLIPRPIAPLHLLKLLPDESLRGPDTLASKRSVPHLTV